jgi:hypothetical protein
MARFTAGPTTEEIALLGIVRRETNPHVRSLLMAHVLMRHVILAGDSVAFATAVFAGDAVSGPSGRPVGGWTPHVHAALRTFCPGRVFHPVELHYLQRWVRQLLDPVGAVVAADFGNSVVNVGLLYQGVRPCVTQLGDIVLRDHLDGLAVAPSTAISAREERALMSVVRPRGSTATAVLVGPLAYANHDDDAPFGIRMLSAREEVTIYRDDQAVSPVEDRVWLDGMLPGVFRYVQVAYNNGLTLDGRHRGRSVVLNAGDQVKICYT